MPKKHRLTRWERVDRAYETGDWHKVYAKPGTQQCLEDLVEHLAGAIAYWEKNSPDGMTSSEMQDLFVGEMRYVQNILRNHISATTKEAEMRQHAPETLRMIRDEYKAAIGRIDKALDSIEPVQ